MKARIFLSALPVFTINLPLELARVKFCFLTTFCLILYALLSIDIDECVTAQDDCNRESQSCLNTKGNFTCIDKVSKKICPPGFKKNLYTQQCEDINECEEIENVCAANEECINDPGGHTCVIKVSKVPLITRPTSTTPLVPITPVYSSSTTPFSTTPVSSTTRSTPEVPPPPPTLPQKPPIAKYSPYQPPNVTSQTQPTSRYFPATQATIPPFFKSRSTPPVKCPRGFEHSGDTGLCEGKKRLYTHCLCV